MMSSNPDCGLCLGFGRYMQLGKNKICPCRIMKAKTAIDRLRTTGMPTTILIREAILELADKTLAEAEKAPPKLEDIEFTVTLRNHDGKDRDEIADDLTFFLESEPTGHWTVSWSEKGV